MPAFACAQKEQVAAKKCVHAGYGDIWETRVVCKIMRKCRRCKKELSPSEFGKSARSSDGRQTICKPCDVKAVQESRKRKQEGTLLPAHLKRTPDEVNLQILNRQLELAKVATGFRQMEQENQSIEAFSKILKLTEYRRWQDATKSDFGIRRKGSSLDQWLPIQIKSSIEKAGMGVKMLGRDGNIPNCDFLCVLLKEPVSFVFVPKESLHLIPISNCGVWQVSAMHEWLVPSNELDDVLWTRWHEREELIKTERQLRFEVNSKYLVEMESIELSNRLSPFSKVEWPAQTMGVTDLIRDGEREQYKSAYVNGNCFNVHLWKKMCGVQVAYEIGDNDWYVVGFKSTDLFLQWRIPESYLISIGMLSRRNHDGSVFVEPGRTRLTLAVPSSTGENHDIQMHLFGKMPNRDANLSTGVFLRVLWLG
jgi:hypothetical protein